MSAGTRKKIVDFHKILFDGVTMTDNNIDFKRYARREL
jgi:hypothetical protein